MSDTTNSQQPKPVYRIDERVAQYVYLRDLLAEKKKVYKADIAPIEEAMGKLGGSLLRFLNGTGQKSARTAYGTVIVLIEYSARCTDPDAFITYVRENDAWELVDRRANKTAVKVFAETHGNLPPGVELNSYQTIGVRQS
jgi:hypothetical protein